MITPSEAGITTDQHTYLKTSIREALFNIKLYQWLPSFDSQSTPSVNSPIYDAITYNGVTRVTPWKLSVAGVSFADFTVPDNLAATPPSLVVDTDLYLFFVTDTGISLSTFDGSTQSSWTEVVTQADIVFMAATASNRIHFITVDANHNYNFHVAKYSGSWTVQDSDIYWGFNITSFSAKRIGTKDILAFTSDAPGVITNKVVGTTVTKVIIPSGGIFGFTYKYNSWSDHFEIEKIDQWSSFRYRSNLKLSMIDNTFWLTCYSSDGTKEYPITGHRVYSSKDGTHWTRGELFPFQNILDGGITLLALNDTVYGVTYSRTYSAQRTLLFDSPHADTILDISRRVKDLSLTRNDMQQVNLSIDNQNNWTADTIADGLHTLALKMQTGFASGTGSVLIDTGIFEVDSLEMVKDMPLQMINISARDRMAWMSSKFQAEQAVIWNPQVVGMDEYIDTTGTGYGGLTHTATEKGSYKASDGVLQLDDNNVEGIAYSTWLYDNWNGAMEINFTLSHLANSEYAGIIFRSPDKDNGLIYRYTQSDDKLHLISRVAGIDTNLWSSSTKSWSSAIAPHFLRVDFRYSRIKMYSSNSSSGGGIVWSLEHSMLIDGELPIVDDVLTPLLENGYVGTIGKGFSDQDGSIPTPTPIDPGGIPYPPYVPPTIGLPGPDNIPGITGATPLEALTFSASEAKATRWTDVFGTPVPHSRDTGLSGIPQAYYSNPWGFDSGFCFNSGGVDYAAHLGAGFTTWVNRRTLTQLYGAGATQTLWAKGSHLVNGWGIAQGDNGFYAVTTDNWVTCTTYESGYFSVKLAPHNANILVGVYHLGQVNGVHWQYNQYDYSLDGGVTWTSFATNDPDPTTNANNISWLDIEIPYLRPSGVHNTYDSGLVIREVGSWRNGGTHTGHYQESNNKGVSFAYAIDTAAGDSNAYLYDNTSYQGAVSTHTWDAKVSIWSHFNPTSPFSINAVISLDHGATIRSNTALFPAAGDDFPVLRHNGWPSVGTTDPLTGYWISTCYLGAAPTDGGVKCTPDNGDTWIILNDPSWTSPGSCYGEFRLATV